MELTHTPLGNSAAQLLAEIPTLAPSGTGVTPSESRRPLTVICVWLLKPLAGRSAGLAETVALPGDNNCTETVPSSVRLIRAPLGVTPIPWLVAVCRPVATSSRADEYGTTIWPFVM